ncbi:aminoglycoside phosphotransferase family protein [Permianibacter aggregans]|uniref:Aminoglycoside phosphotransferase domain-containing protein n=1 Tax=Permianibacter aggregans TaxID=1510150 RepID=A0A4R6UL38_9GAMM|nr:phosphotransferase [Permianibacter aggregans]QGX39072.1 hypothetical protein E2H98_05105 [Permianibacter aggregans]TDQ47720.1 hypothetical protein EV696_109124 [Permianibacter aggregans]
MDTRQAALQSWVQQQTSIEGEWQLVSGDASFRRYFRWQTSKQSYIAVDAPPERENTARFVELASALNHRGVPVTKVLAHDLKQGFMLQEDLGEQLLLPLLTPENETAFYGHAMRSLLQWQSVRELPLELEHYRDGRLQTELTILPEWFLVRHLNLPFSDDVQAMYRQQGELLLQSAAEQPELLTHRDFHSRNLMLQCNRNRIIDFQDAVWGPATYDLVSLLKDCYYRLPPERVRQFALDYHSLLLSKNLLPPVSENTWLRWFDWMGLQRHLKVLGIFARLAHRDGKTLYLRDLPLTLRYCLETTAAYDELKPLSQWLHEEIAPRIPEALA